MDQAVEDKFNQVIGYLANISASLESLSEKSIDRKEAKLGYKTEYSSEDADNSTEEGGPREILDKQNVIDDYGTEARKFWTNLFEKYFGAGEKKQEEGSVDKPTSFWKKLLGLLPVIAAAAFGAFDKILKWLNNLKILDRIKKWWGELKLFDKIKNFFKELKLIEKIKGFFLQVKAGIVKQLSKSKLGRTILKAFRFVSNKVRSVFRGLIRGIKSIKSGSLGRAFGKTVQGIGRVFKSLFKGIKAGVNSGAKIFKTILRAVKGVFKGIGAIGKFFPGLVKAFKFGGKLLGKLFLPLTILFTVLDIADGIMTNIKQKGLSFTSVIEGLAAGIIQTLTLGFFDTETILTALDDISTTLGDFFYKITEVPGKVGKWVKEKVKLIPFADKFFDLDETTDDILEEYGDKPLDKEGMSRYKDALQRQREKESQEAIKEKEGNWWNPFDDFVSRPNEPAIPFSSEDTVVGFKEGGPLALLSKQTIDTQKEHLEVSKSMVDILQQAANQLISLNDNLAKNIKSSQNLVISAPKVSNYSNQGGSNQTAFRLGSIN